MSTLSQMQGGELGPLWAEYDRLRPPALSYHFQPPNLSVVAAVYPVHLFRTAESPLRSEAWQY
jgi:hypothetical protein